MKIKKTIKFILSIVLSAYILWAFIKYFNFDFTVLPKVLSQIPVSIYISIFIVNIIVNMLRSVRFNLFLQAKVPFITMFEIVNIHQFYNSVLPYRTGEISYMYLLKNKQKINMSESTSSLFLSRVMDILGLFFCCALSLWVSLFSVNADKSDINLAAGILFFIALIGFIFLYRVGFVLKICIAIINKFKLGKYIFIGKIVNFLKNIVENITQNRSAKKQILTILVTILLTLAINFNTFLLIRYFNINLNFFELFVASSFTFLTAFLPIQGVANVGTYEGTFILGLVLMGIERNIGLSAAFSSHIVFYLMFIFTFIFFKLFYFVNKAFIKKTE